MTEAIVVGTIFYTQNSIPNAMRSLMFNGNVSRPFAMNDLVIQSMLELQDQIFEIPKDFDA